MYVTVFAAWSIAPSVPCAGSVTFESVSGSPSGSVQVSGIETAVPTFVLRVTSWHVGARVTFSVTVAVAPVAEPSVAR